MGNWRETTNLGVGSGTESVDYSYTSELYNDQSFWFISHTKNPCQTKYSYWCKSRAMDKRLCYLFGPRLTNIGKQQTSFKRLPLAVKGEILGFIYDFLPKV